MANVTLRIFADDDDNLHSARAGLYVNAEACNTGTACEDQPFSITSRTADFAGPTLTPDSLPDLGGVEATGPLGGVATFTPPTAFDEGDGEVVAVTCEIESGSTFPIGTTDNHCGASDSAGNATEVAFTVEVVDTTAPGIEVVIPAAVSFPLEAEGPDGAPLDYDGWIAVDDMVDAEPSVECVPASGVFAIGETIVNCTATDFSGNAAAISFDVSVADSIAPQLVLPVAPVVAEATGPNGVVVEFAANAADTVDGAPAVACAPASGSLFGVGATTVACTATDFSGNSSTGAFTVTVDDTTAPALTVPGAVVVEAQDPSGAVVSYPVTATDTVDNMVVTACTPGSGLVFALGATIVTCAATDTAGNTAAATFAVTVVDTTAPTLTLPADLIVEATGLAGAVAIFEVAAADTVDPAPEVLCTPPSASVLPLGNTLIDCTATDASGNTASASFDIDVIDSTPPILVLPADLTVDATSTGGAIVTFTATATDVVDTSVSVDCTPESGSLFPTGETVVTCTATDDAGLTDVAGFKINVALAIIWIEPVADPHYDTIGPNLNLRWGYGAGDVLFASRDVIDTPPGKSTDPVFIEYRGPDCSAANPMIVNLDAGSSSLRYSRSEWHLNWQTGQSLLDNGPLQAGCYVVGIPRAFGGWVDEKRVILSE